MKINLPSAVTSRVARTAFIAQQKSPTLLFAGGLVLMGATIVSSSRATLRLGEELDHIRAERDDIKAVVAARPEEYVEKDVNKLNMYVTSKGILKIAKLYLPTLALGVAAVACLTTSHNQLSRRNAGLSAALAATERALNAYRDRIRDAYGEDRERELWRGEKTETVPVLDDEGRETKSTKKVKTGGGYSPYARMWGRDTSSEWSPDPLYNLPKLRTVQEYLTMRLNQKGFVTLNEAHEELGLSWTYAGQQVGWLAKKFGGADGFVDFGVLEYGDNVAFRDFLTGDAEHIWLDFNVDGEIARFIG